MLLKISSAKMAATVFRPQCVSDSTSILISPRYCPIGITFLLASKIVQMKDPATSFTQLAYYMATVIVGLATHFFIILPLLYFIFTRKNPFKFMAQMSPALFLAVSTASRYAWWRHPMEAFSALLALCAGNSPVAGEFPLQWPVTRRFDVFVGLRLNKKLSKQSRGWWFGTQSRSLWRHSNGTHCTRMNEHTTEK